MPTGRKTRSSLLGRIAGKAPETRDLPSFPANESSTGRIFIAREDSAERRPRLRLGEIVTRLWASTLVSEGHLMSKGAERKFANSWKIEDAVETYGIKHWGK